ncbi:MAG TPA: type II secretion system inner membrane protein GspF [Candidatus Acidoferrales bacterium]|nr:type II secretion system inner membrane protein GspF [Candidatus Acidoferrales bacterium]
MPVYAYKGLNQGGRAVSGIIDADTPKGARLKLRGNGIFPTDLTEEQRQKTQAAAEEKDSFSFGWFRERITPQELALLTRQLSTLVGAGLPLVDCLSALIEQVETSRTKRMLSQVRELVTEGTSLADALKAHPRIFTDLYVNMVRAGEASGALDVVLLRLADYTESYAALRDKVRSALTYPTLMAIVGSAILFFLLSYVVPKVTKIFTENKATLPVLTTILLTVSGFLQDYWWAVLSVIGVVVVSIKLSLRTPAGRLRFDRYVLSIPYFGKLLKKVALARFSRTLSTLLTSGITLMNSLDIVKNVVGNTVLSAAIDEARSSIREGQSIAPPLKKSGLFPAMLIHMIAVGEKSGELEQMLSKAADAYDNEVSSSVASLTSVLEPVMILIGGAVVLFIVLAILLPIFELNELVR